MEAAVLIKFILCMIPLLALWGLSIALVRIKHGKLALNQREVYFKLLDTLPLAHNNCLHLVKVSDSKVVLLSSTQSQVSCLQTFEPQNITPLHIQEPLLNGELSHSEIMTKIKKLFKSTPQPP
ncbi:MAG: flagellar biosynthetic protein FliO [Candidatus Caenarcaniphilales bacterium]|nr:flagellar biosynthetic protein FliO [Candidatus Caenarcaniphilales bacterium]